MVRRQATVHSSAAPTTVLSLCADALQILGLRKVRREDPDIRAKFGGGMRSWGEIVTLRVTNDGSGGSLVRIDTRSRLRYQMFDWGKSDQGIDALVRAITYLTREIRPS